MHGRRLVSFLAAGLALGGALYLSAQSSEPEEVAADHRLKRVKVAEVEPATGARELRFAGTLRAARRARLGFVAGGRLAARPVEIGDRVRAGAELARLDEREADNDRSGAEAALAELAARRAQSARELRRVERLAASAAATAEELEEARAAHEALEAAETAAASRLREAERRLEERRLAAPFDAVVTEVLLEPGEHAAAGRPVVVLAGEGGVELEVEVPASVALALGEGDAVEVVVPELGGAPLEGRITSLGRTAAGAGRLFPVVVAVAGEHPLLPGMSAEVVLRLPAEGSLAVPVEAVVDPGGRRPAVLRLEVGETVRKVPIEVGELVGERIIVSGELAAGDRVVVGGQRGLLDGEAVEVAP